MARLRDPAGGCPWDLEQTFATIAPYTIEEAYEVADAIERSDLDELAASSATCCSRSCSTRAWRRSAARSTSATWSHGICDKLLRRHPHVFGGEQVDDVGEQSRMWEAIKREERGAAGETCVLADVPVGAAGA